MNVNQSRRLRKFRKKCLQYSCKDLNISLPENATIRQLETAIDEYMKKAVVVHVNDGVAFRHTDNPTAEYTVHFELYCMHTIRAESEVAACSWIKENASFYYRPDIGDADTDGCDILGCYKCDEE